MAAENMEDEPEATEDEYFEQELLDFLTEIQSLKANIKVNKPIGAEPTDIVNAICIRFEKMELPMPDDQHTRVYQGLKIMSDFVVKQPHSFTEWPSLGKLFKVAKIYKARHPQNNKNAVAELLRSAKEFSQATEVTDSVMTSTAAPAQQQVQIQQIPDKPTTTTVAAAQPPASNLIQKKDWQDRSRSRERGDKDRSREKERDRQRERGKIGTKSHHSTSQHHSRSGSTDHHHRSRKSRSHSRGKHRSRSRSRGRHKPKDRWGLPAPRHDNEYLQKMLEWQKKELAHGEQVDFQMDNTLRLAAVDNQGNDICHGFNEGRCRGETCKYSHACWACKSPGHPSQHCKYKKMRPYDAAPDTNPICINWNIYGCNANCVCNDRHVCLDCQGPHPIRHSKVCLWRYKRGIDNKKNTDYFDDDKKESYEARQHLLRVGKYETLRCKAENLVPPSEPTTLIVFSPHSNKVRLPTRDISTMKNYYPSGPPTPDPPINDTTSNNSRATATTTSKQTHAQGATKPTKEPGLGTALKTGVVIDTVAVEKSIYAQSSQHHDQVSITEICVLFNTPCGCPADTHNKQNTNLKCKLKHRCRGCFGFHSWVNCEFTDHSIEILVRGDIVRYRTDVFTINGFPDDSDNDTSSAQNREDNCRRIVQSPYLFLCEVGSEDTHKILASDVSKIVSSVALPCDRPGFTVDTLPTDLTVFEQETKLKQLFVDRKITNVVEIEHITSKSQFQVYFTSVKDRDFAFHTLAAKPYLINHPRQAFNIQKLGGDEADLQKPSKANETPVKPHMFYCPLCDIGVFNRDTLSEHFLNDKHKSQLSKKPRLKLNAQLEAVPHHFCSLCDQSAPDVQAHLNVSKHDNSNILMMLSLVRAEVGANYECGVCKTHFPSSKQYFLHCRTEDHQTKLEEAIEPCPNYNRKNVGCSNDRCQFKHVCVGCGATVPKHSCLRCRSSEICNMYNRGTTGCWFSAGQCHRKHTCLECKRPHPKAGCPQLGLSHKRFDDHGRPLTANGDRMNVEAPPPPPMSGAHARGAPVNYKSARF